MNELSVFLGIDPGTSGHIAVIDREMAFVDSIELKAPEQEISQWLIEISGKYVVELACLETVRSSPLMGVVSAFTFGRSYGLCRGLLAGLQVPFIEARPQQWMKALACMTGGDKDVTRQRAYEIWPMLTFNKGGKLGHYDAMLLAEYARRTYMGAP